MMLARPSLRMVRELWYSIFEEYYSYFLNKSKEARQEELLDLTYYTCWASSVLNFGVFNLGEIFLPDHLQREKEVLKESVNSLTIK